MDFDVYPILPGGRGKPANTINYKKFIACNNDENLKMIAKGNTRKIYRIQFIARMIFRIYS